jgi:uncharacterized protein YndB with AHSA1/START domain
MTFTFPETVLENQPSTLLGTVTELVPPRRFSFTWGEDHLHFELEPLDGGSACLMRFMVELGTPDKAARDAAGWHVCLDALELRLRGAGVATPHAP